MLSAVPKSTDRDRGRAKGQIRQGGVGGWVACFSLEFRFSHKTALRFWSGLLRFVGALFRGRYGTLSSYTDRHVDGQRYHPRTL